jgi:hypothetical protein
MDLSELLICDDVLYGSDLKPPLSNIIINELLGFRTLSIVRILNN